MIEKFTNQYSLSKTLRFKLIPVGKTEENFNNKLLLEQDEKRAESYSKVKEYMDRYHKFFINDTLSNIPYHIGSVDSNYKHLKSLEQINEYAELYYKATRSEAEDNRMISLEKDFRKSISQHMKKDERYKKLKGKEFIREILPEYLSDNDEKEIVAEFNDFSTYFVGFNQNRENMYTEEEQSTGIAFRCVNDNLPKFLDNAKSFLKVREILNADEFNSSLSDVLNVNATDVFSIDYYPFVLSQFGIDTYNQVLGGYTTDSGEKLQGINELINLYNQQVAKNDKSLRLPLMKPLFKQILSDRESVSFIPEQFKDDCEVATCLKELNDSVSSSFEEIKSLFNSFSSYNSDGIYVINGLAITNLSNAVFGSWNIIQDAWNEKYSEAYPMKKKADEEKYLENRRKAYKKIQSFSLSELQSYGDKSIADYYNNEVNTIIDNIESSYKELETIISASIEDNKSFSKDKTAVEKVKNYLDAIKELERLLKPLCGSGKESEKDNEFYGIFLPLFDKITLVDAIYDKTRNYMTKKPYSTEKIKLNFENPQFLGGWDKNKERDYRCVLLKKGDCYYLAIMDKSNSKIFVKTPEVSTDTEYFDKVEYKLLPGPNKMLPKVFFAKSNIDFYAPSAEILRIRTQETFKKGSNFSIDDCHKFIDFYKESIDKHEDWSKFNFDFKPTQEYEDIGEFYKDVKTQGYSMTYSKVPDSYIEDCVDNGQLYLFQIYNKDFSKYTHGTPNLHTMYFRMLFDERNLSDVVYKLNGEAEMFYRKASIKENEKVVHPANQEIENKNPLNENNTSTFEYDLIKDKRFTKRQFMFHVPITMNFKSGDSVYRLNDSVRSEIVKSPDQHIIGIDRGERNLIYITVIDGNGKIVEQTSLNEIVSDNNYRVNYQELLDRKEKERDAARKSWATIGNIKELKEGYISQVVHKICQLVIKYDAIIAMEDLNGGFMNSRVKVEKSVYQKFEKALTDKLNYLVDKNTDPESLGGVLKAYQLTNKADGKSRGAQDGIIFYIPAWLTSKIDPITGFVNLIKAKYTSVDSARDFFERFDDIRYNSSTDMFEFDLDYSKFPRGSVDYKQKWTVCSNGERIKNFRNPEKNSEWDNEVVNLTKELKSLFNKADIDYTSNLKNEILSQNSKDFFKEIMHLFNLTMQMRNSITGNTEVDYLISPVRDENGNFYDSREYESLEYAELPQNADANGAYNIARKALWAVQRIKESDDVSKAKLSISNKEWLEYAQS